MRHVVFFLAALLILAPPAAAQAPTEYVGETSQGKRIRLVTAPDGSLQRGRIFWRANCNRYRVLRDVTGFRPPFDTPGDPFADAGPYVDRGPRYRLRVFARIAGDFADDRSSVTGTARFRIRVRRNGRLVARCNTGPLTWTAARQ